MSNTVVCVATCSIEAARHVEVLPDGHRCRSMHGHHFQVSVFARVPVDWAPFPGDESAEIERRLRSCLSPLDYSLLNSVIPHPTDENIGRWVLGNIDVPGVDRVAVQSTEFQGVDLNCEGDAHVWRKYEFQAAHQLPNVPAGHKCGRMHGHSFEVLIHVRQNIGGLDLGVDYDDLDSCWHPLNEELSYRCLNDIEGLVNPTSENISAWLWRRLKFVLPHLSSVSVFETSSCGANFDGSVYRIWKEFTLDSAVQIRRAPMDSPKRRVHGYTYSLRLHLLAPLDKVMGWTVDFGDVKSIFDPIYKSLDHHALFKIEGLNDGDPKSVADWIFHRAKVGLVELYQVDFFEIRGCGVVIAAGEPNFFLKV